MAIQIGINIEQFDVQFLTPWVRFERLVEHGNCLFCLTVGQVEIGLFKRIDFRADVCILGAFLRVICR